MYKHILLPTDGSALSESAIESGIRLAQALGARVTGLHVAAKLEAIPLESWARGDAKRGARLKEMFAEQAKQYLAVIEAAAKQAGVPCKCLCVTGASPAEEIVKTAKDKRCDLIYMASHGKAGTSALLLGSETAKVLIHSPIPVLVHRERASMPVGARRSGALRTGAGARPSAKRRLDG
jgi:nucleotide-binding universal stress UspA family protein